MDRSHKRVTEEASAFAAWPYRKANLAAAGGEVDDSATHRLSIKRDVLNRHPRRKARDG